VITSSLLTLLVVSYLCFSSADDVYEFLGTVSSVHGRQAVVVMLCALLACPAPCGIPLTLLLETMHHIYEPPEDPPSALHQSAASASMGEPHTESSTLLSSPSEDTTFSPPLMRRTAGSPFRPAATIPRNTSLQDVARSLPFDAEQKPSHAADSSGPRHRSVQFLIIASCIKPMLAVTFFAATPSLSLAGAHVRV
jgi:hypothetical protein